VPWHLIAQRGSESSELGGACVQEYLVALDTAVEAPLEPAELYVGIWIVDARSVADLLSKPSVWMSRAPIAG
jgi:hypothetical protein